MPSTDQRDAQQEKTIMSMRASRLRAAWQSGWRGRRRRKPLGARPRARALDCLSVMGARAGLDRLHRGHRFRAPCAQRPGGGGGRRGWVGGAPCGTTNLYSSSEAFTTWSPGQTRPVCSDRRSFLFADKPASPTPRFAYSLASLTVTPPSTWPPLHAYRVPLRGNWLVYPPRS